MSTVIKADSISKMYRLGQFNTGALSQDLQRWFALFRGKEDPFLKIGESNDRSTKGNSNVVWSLKDVNLEVEYGDTVGIIGKNGAGKSTLLKILSRVTSPTSGEIKVKGRVASLLEVGTGFHPELTGRENIFLNGAILGMRKAEIKEQLEAIVEFAGVARYLDTPVKRYSSGMFVRLGFAVAAHLRSEILIVDEVLAVGDAEFQKKCLGKMGEINKGQGRTILFVSHNLNSIRKLCKSAIVLDKGSSVFSGNVLSGLESYLSLSEEIQKGTFIRSRKMDTEISINEIQLSSEGDNSNAFQVDQEIVIKLKIDIDISVTDANIFLTILDTQKRPVFSCESDRVEKCMTLRIAPLQLVRGAYSLNVMVNVPNVRAIEVLEDVCKFTIIDHTSPMSTHGDFDYGVVFSNFSWIYD